MSVWDVIVIFVNCFFSAAFLTQTVCLDDTTVKFEIWDTAGQERYHSLAPMYYRGAQAAIVVYDITNQVRGVDLSDLCSCNSERFSVVKLQHRFSSFRFSEIVAPTDRPAGHLCRQKISCWTLHPNFPTNFFLTCHVYRHQWLYHFIPIALTLTLAGGYKVSAKQNLLASFSHTLFDWSGWGLMWFGNSSSWQSSCFS